MPNWKDFFMGKKFFAMLALLFAFLSMLFVIRHAKFVFQEFEKGFGREDGNGALPQFDIEGFKKLNLITK